MGMPFQLFVLLGGAAYLGLQLDKYYNHEINYLAAVFSIIVLFIFLYRIIKAETKP